MEVASQPAARVLGAAASQLVVGVTAAGEAAAGETAAGEAADGEAAGVASIGKARESDEDEAARVDELRAGEADTD